jgi:hypothetical protein
MNLPVEVWTSGAQLVRPLKTHQKLLNSTKIVMDRRRDECLATSHQSYGTTAPNR